tara:strand:+ start:1963 stop:2097 length:135 start_codon:yes stop_codon:yes gene_type:complete
MPPAEGSWSSPGDSGFVGTGLTEIDVLMWAEQWMTRAVDDESSG